VCGVFCVVCVCVWCVYGVCVVCVCVCVCVIGQPRLRGGSVPELRSCAMENYMCSWRGYLHKQVIQAGC